MKLITETREIIKSQDFETMNYGVDTKNLPLLFKMLRTNLYADLYGSIIRELASNVVDSHTEAKKPDALGEIEWVNENRGLGIDCQLIVRDFGVGLSPERMKTVYGNYLSSTKREDNDQIGGFGLGSKVPFAYTDSFFVQTNFDGERSKYLCYIDDSDMGAISLLERIPTTDGNQTEIVIPIKNKDDKGKFQAAINRQLPYFNCFKYIGIESPSSEVLHEDDTCIVLNRAPIDKAHLVVGNIAYEIDFNFLGITVTTHTDPAAMLTCGVGIKINIGEVQPTLSREGLFWTEKTKVLVLDRIQKAKKAIAKELLKEVNEEKDYAKWYGMICTGGTRTLPKQWKFAELNKNLKYEGNGFTLSPAMTDKKWFADHRIRTVESSSFNSKRRTKTTNFNSDYRVDDCTHSDLRDLPAYSITDKYDAKTCNHLFKLHGSGFITVKYNPNTDDNGVPKPVNDDYSKATAAWMASLPVYEAVVVPDDSAPTNWELQEAKRKAELKLRKIEGRYVAKILRSCIGGGAGSTWLERQFCYNIYEGKFEIDKEGIVVYGFQEDHAKLCQIASYLNLAAGFKKRWEDSYDGTKVADKFRILFLKVSREHAKTFAQMPKAHYVDNVLALKTELNEHMAKVTTAHRIKPYIHMYHALSFFGNINKSMRDKYLKLHKFVESFALAEAYANDSTINEMHGLNVNNLDAEMEYVWKSITDYFKDVELLSCVNFSMYSEEHKKYGDNPGTTVTYLDKWVHQNTEAIKKYLVANKKEVDGVVGKPETLVPEEPVESVTVAEEKVAELV